MRRFWVVFYNAIVVPLLGVAILTAAVFEQKVRRGIRGRQNLLSTLATRTSSFRLHRSPRIWFHSSSLGEFEQAKPIIAELKRRRPDCTIVASFFSPSGYDHSKNYKLADVITYLPFDSYSNARRFVATVAPDAAVMVRYDVWPNHIWALQRDNVPLFLANATMRRHSLRRLPVVRNFHHTVYNAFDYILTVSDKDVDAFKQFQLSKPRIDAIGDTRFDQVWQRSIESRAKHILPRELTAKKLIIIVGSSWDSDEAVLIPALARLTKKHKRLLIILVPHEPTLDNLERIERELEGRLTAIRFSDLHDYRKQDVVIIDSVGILMSLYRYADVSFVGGSFKQGIHNVLEPAVYGQPVVFGPVYHNSHEASQLIGEGAGFVGSNEEELFQHFDTLLSSEALRLKAGKRAKAFVERNTGATRRFLSYLEKVL